MFVPVRHIFLPDTWRTTARVRHQQQMGAKETLLRDLCSLVGVLGRRKRPRPRVGAATFRAAVGGRRRRARAGGRGALSLPCGRHRCGREVVALPAPGYATPAVANPAGQRRRTIHQALPVKSQAHRRCARGRTGRAGFDLRAILTSRPLAFRLLVGSSVYHHSD
jgi:hypothetical protein